MLKSHTKLGIESTVGAGTPVIHTLKHVIASGDEVVKIQVNPLNPLIQIFLFVLIPDQKGALSGTLGYLMSGLQVCGIYF